MTENHTPDIALRIRITALPDANLFEEYDLRHFHVGGIYAVPIRLASLLILSGYAERAGGVVAAEAADTGIPKFFKPKNKSQ